MEKRKLGQTDMNVTVLGFGGAEIGFENPDQKDVEQLLNEALDAGLNVIDTGECYIDSEARIGKAVSHRRNDYHLFTKLGHHFQGAPDLPDWDPKLLQLSVEHSLGALQTDHLDLLQIHGCSIETLEAGHVVEILQRAKREGKARYIGYSGDNEEALHAIGMGVFDVLQTSINVADQRALSDVLPNARAKGLGVIAKRPVGNVAWANGASPPKSDYAKPYWERLQELRYPLLADPLEVSVSTALRFTLSQPGVCTAIVGTRSPGRWLQNAGAVALGPLPEPEADSIRARWREVAQPDWVQKG